MTEVFRSLRSKSIEIYELDHGYFLSTPGLSWQACLKKTEVELELLTDLDKLLMLEKGIRGGMMKTVKKDTYLKLMLSILGNYKKNTVTDHTHKTYVIRVRIDIPTCNSPTNL